MKKRILFLLVVLNQFIFGVGYAPSYGPGADWTVLSSTSNAFIIFDDISFNGSDVDSGIEDGPTGGCPTNDCDILGAMYNGLCIGWTYMPITNGGVTLAIELNDNQTEELVNYPAVVPGTFDPIITFNFFDASAGEMFYNIASSPLQLGAATLYGDLSFTGSGSECSTNGFAWGPPTLEEYCLSGNGCNLSENEYFDPIGDGLVDCNGDEWVDEQGVLFNYDFNDGANLIGFFGNEYFTLNNDSIDNNSISSILNISDINFILGAGTALFPYDWDENGEILEDENISCYNDQWFAEDGTEYCYTFEGNLSTLTRGSGYWVSTKNGLDQTVYFDENSVDNCIEPFEDLSSYNNLVAFYWDGNNHNIFDALGGIEYATDNFEHIVGAGKIRKNICDEGTQDENCWIGNLNTMVSGAGYWLHLKDATALSFGVEDFSWGFANCANPPEGGNLTKDDDFLKIPEEYQFIQSTEQAFYVINGIDGANTGDIITAQCGDKLVGSAFWDGEFTAIPVMGRDFNEQTEGNCEIDEVPMFILNKSTGIMEHILFEDIPGFVNSGIFIIEKLESIDSNFVPNEILLSPAYPNPFNPVTNISYGLPLETHITLNVYDVEGRKITTLTEGIRSAGTHSFEWSAEGYPSGVYFVKLDADEFTQTQKLMLVK